MNSITSPPPFKTVWPKLHDAIWRARDEEGIRELTDLLRGGAAIDEVAHVHTARDMSVLHTAVGCSTEVCKLLLSCGAVALLEAKCSSGTEGRHAGLTALQMAAKRGRSDIANQLLASGAEYDALSAAAMGDVSRLEELLESGRVVLDSKDLYHSTLMHWAAGNGQTEVARYLISHGIKIESTDLFGETPLLRASAANQPEFAALMLRHGARIDVFSAAALGDLKELARLLQQDGNLVGARTRHGSTPLHWAVRSDQLEAAQYLVHRGAEIDSRDAIGWTALWYAAYWKQNEITTKWLCEQGAGTTLVDMWECGILSYDCGANCARILQEASQRGESID